MLRVNPRGRDRGAVKQEGKRKVKGLVEVADFFLLGFEVVVIGMGQNKIQDEEPGADQFVGETTAVAEIVLLDGHVEGPCKEVVDQRVPSQSGSPYMTVLQGFHGQAGAHTSSIDPGKIEELPLGEVPRVGGNEVEEARFGRGVTVSLDGLDVFGTNAHRERMSSMISGSAIARRRRTASSAKAYRVNPARALSAI